VLVDGEVDFLDSQLALALILWLQLLYSFDEVWLLETTIAGLVPIAENFLQITHFEFLEVNCVEVDLFVWNLK
jgi:hypothetical protein